MVSSTVLREPSGELCCGDSCCRSCYWIVLGVDLGGGGLNIPMKYNRDYGPLTSPYVIRVKGYGGRAGIFVEQFFTTETL